MYFKNKILQQRYSGFLQTACLWKNNEVLQLFQHELSSKIDVIDINIDEKQRLGKYVEHFVVFNLKQQKNVKLLAENIQIQKEKRTVGELDCIFIEDEIPIHLEIVYKFYLYVPNLHKDELYCFIGPNRKDSLIEKLIKLKSKQLPLLHHTSTKPYLNELHLKSDSIQQKVCFKGQLFMPFTKSNTTLKSINTDCISGFYINVNELNGFKNCKFYIPSKKDWLITPHKNVNWLTFFDFKSFTSPLLSRNFSPLCWVKKENGEVEKFFLVWWDVSC